MTHTRMIILALFAALSLAVFSGCSAEDIESKTNNALGDVKDKMGNMSLDGIKDALGSVDGIEAKAKEMGKLDIPAVKDLLAKRPEIQKLVDGINADNMVAKLKELAPQFSEFSELVKKAKSALGM